MNSPDVVVELTSDGKKLTAKSGQGVSRYFHLPLRLLHMQADDGVVVAIVRHEEMGDSILRLSLADAHGVAILNRLPNEHDDVAVSRLLQRSKERGADVKVADSVGTLQHDQGIITVTIDGQIEFYRDDDPRRPSLLSLDRDPDGGLLLVLRIADTTRRLRIDPPTAIAARRAALFLNTEGAAVTATPKIRWEYRLVKNMLASSLESELNVLGNDGWELVAVTGLDGVLTFTGNKLVAVLKRPVGPGVRRRGM